MTVRSTEYFAADELSLLKGQTEPANKRKAHAIDAFQLPAINHGVVDQTAGILVSAGSGLLLMGLFTVALAATVPGDWFRIVACFAAISGFIYLGFAIDAENLHEGFTDSVTAIVIFGLTYVSLKVDPVFLGLAFATGIAWALKELWLKPRRAVNTNLLAGWASINLGAILMLTFMPGAA